MKSTDDKKIDEILTRGVTELIDPAGIFKDKLQKKARGEYTDDIIIKFGVDPTAPDIHLGHAVIFKKLRDLQDIGCKIVFVIGDFTAQIGDPTGKNKLRPELDNNSVEKNVQTFLKQINKLLDVSDINKYDWIRNSDWFMGIVDLNPPQKDVSVTQNDKTIIFQKDSFFAKAANFLEFKKTRSGRVHRESFQDVSVWRLFFTLRHITHQRLIERSMFQNRINSGKELYIHEMLYPVLQGIDSHVLTKQYGDCSLEIGGTDQTFNMLMGRDVMKINKQEPQAVMSMEILEGTDGKEKMSKSLGNYIGITEAPTDMFGKIMSIPDTSITQYFKLCTFVPEDELEKINERVASKNTNPRDEKLRLAHQIVAIYHGEEAAEKAEKDFINTFSKKEIPNDILEVTAEEEEFLIDVLARAKIISSKSELRRLAESGGIHDLENGTVIKDVQTVVRNPLTLKIGKKKFIKIILK